MNTLNTLTPFIMQQLIQQECCSLIYRYDHIHAFCPLDGREYHICHVSQIAQMTPIQFQQALVTALSFRLTL